MCWPYLPMRKSERGKKVVTKAGLSFFPSFLPLSSLFVKSKAFFLCCKKCEHRLSFSVARQTCHKCHQILTLVLFAVIVRLWSNIVISDDWTEMKWTIESEKGLNYFQLFWRAVKISTWLATRRARLQSWQEHDWGSWSFWLDNCKKNASKPFFEANKMLAFIYVTEEVTILCFMRMHTYM
jgi:hypothetical protein